MTVQDYFDAIRECGLPELSNTVLYDLLNQGYAEVVADRRWPFRLATSTGDAPLAIAALGEVDTVLETTNDNYLELTTQDELEARGVDLTLTGTPTCYYMSDSLTVSAYPLGEIAVRYWKTTTTLATLSSTLMIPDAYKLTVVYAAAKHGHLRTGVLDLKNEYAAEAERAKASMARALMHPTNPLVTSAYT